MNSEKGPGISGISITRTHSRPDRVVDEGLFLSSIETVNIRDIAHSGDGRPGISNEEGKFLDTSRNVIMESDRPPAVGVLQQPRVAEYPNIWASIQCFFFLGFQTFGGTTAQIELLRSTFVYKRQWLDDWQFDELLNFGKTIPGPTSVQMVAAMGSMWLGGIKGALVAGFLYLLPGFILTYFCALFLRRISEADPRAFSPQWFTEFGPSIPPEPLLAIFSELSVGFPPSAVAYASYHCLRSMQEVCFDGNVSFLAIFSTLAAILIPRRQGWWGYPLILFTGGVLSLLEALTNQKSLTRRRSKRFKNREDWIGGEGGKIDLFWTNTGTSKVCGRLLLLAWIVGLLVLIGIRVIKDSSPALTVFNLFYRIGSMAFGDDYTILLNIHAEMDAMGIPPPTILFLGLAVIHMLPGHVFLLSLFLGSYFLEIGGGALAGLGVALPALCITLGALNCWEYIRQEKLIFAILGGMKAAGIGLEVGLLAGMFIQVVNGCGPLCVAILTVSLVVCFKVSLPGATAIGALFGWCLLKVDVGGPYCWLPSYIFQSPKYEQICLQWYNMQNGFMDFHH